MHGILHKIIHYLNKLLKAFKHWIKKSKGGNIKYQKDNLFPCFAKYGAKLSWVGCKVGAKCRKCDVECGLINPDSDAYFISHFSPSILMSLVATRLDLG